MIGFSHAIRWKEAMGIVRHCGLAKVEFVGRLALFYVLTVLNAVFEGTGFVLLINLVTGKISETNPDLVTQASLQVMQKLGVDHDAGSILIFVVSLFLIRAALVFLVESIGGVLNAEIRRRIQERGFASLMQGDWEYLRDIRVGQRVGAVTEESVVVAKYLISIVRTSYAILTGLVLIGIALMVSIEITLLMIVVAIPVLLFLQWMFFRVSRLSYQHVGQRQGFAADVTERLTGLFQIKVEALTEQHTKTGLRHQERLTALERGLAYCQATITASNVALPALVLFACSVWFWLRGESILDSMHLLAGVGVVGARAAAQFNVAAANLGNLSRLSGSIVPVFQLFTVPQEPVKQAIHEKVVALRLEDVSYSYNESARVSNVNFTVALARPFLIRGPSGAGKTTLANLIAGLYKPSSGRVVYRGISGRDYHSERFRPLVGYVTQDIYLLHGSVRDNLSLALDRVEDDWLWNCLRQVGAEEFVQELGGLEAVIAEAGRSLSGGERRRLGIARVLARRPDILILDEVTAGLDQARKQELVGTIEKLSSALPLIIISHEPLQLKSADEWTLEVDAVSLKPQGLESSVH